MNNPVNWLEIATTDLERAKKFYAQIFKLEFQYIEMPDSKMYMFGEPNNPGSAGSLVQAEGSVPSQEGTVIYFSCEDVNNQLGQIEAAGGSIVIPKTDIGEFGFFAHILDTEGNRIGLHSNK